MSKAIDFRIQVLLSFQRALWDMVTPALRGVAVRPTEPLIEARFLYEHEPTEEEVELVSMVATYVIADFLPPTDFDFRAVAVVPPSPRELLSGEEWVYLRHEPAADR